MSSDPALQALFKGLEDVLYIISDAARNKDTMKVLQEYDMLVSNELVEEFAHLLSEQREVLELARTERDGINVLTRAFLQRRQVTPAGTVYIPERSPPAVTAEVRALLALERKIEVTWGVALLTAMGNDDDEEYHREIIEDFERQFERQSVYLRALVLPSTSARDMLEIYFINELQLFPDVVLAALAKHPVQGAQEVVAALEYAKEREVPITLELAEAFEKAFTKCMKENVEECFQTYLGAGLVPLSTRPFAMVFNAKSLKTKTVVDYYDLMLDYGIPPEESTLRILCKQCVGPLQFARNHFTQCQKSQGEDPSETPESRRRQLRSYFEKRLEDLAGQDGEVPPLLEAMKVVHRALVEGTSLEGDISILACLLKYFCNGTTPLAELQQPFTESAAWFPDKVTNGDDDGDAAAAAGGDQRDARSAILSAAPTNAFDFGLDDGVDELLEDESGGGGGGGGLTLEEELEGDLSGDDALERMSNNSDGGGAAAAADDTARPQHRNGLSGRRQRKPGTASPKEEAAYVLKVLASYGSHPDDMLLHKVTRHFDELEREEAYLPPTRKDCSEAKMAHIDITEQIVNCMFELGHATRGAVEAVRCRKCLDLVYHFTRRRERARLSELIKKIVVQNYEYTHLFGASWVGPDNGQRDNGKSFVSFAVAAMKSNSLDFALGMFALALVMVPYHAASFEKVQRKILQLRDYAQSSPYTPLTPTQRATVAELERCDFDKRRILLNATLMSDPFDLSSSGNGGGAGLDGGQESIFTASSQEPSSYRNPRSSEATPSLMLSMHLVLREMGVEREVIDWYKKTLRDGRLAALANIATNKDTQ